MYRYRNNGSLDSGTYRVTIVNYIEKHLSQELERGWMKAFNFDDLRLISTSRLNERICRISEAPHKGNCEVRFGPVWPCVGAATDS